MPIHIPTTIYQSMAHIITNLPIPTLKALNHPKATLKYNSVIAPADPNDPDDIPNIMYYNPLPKRLYSALIRANQ